MNLKGKWWKNEGKGEIFTVLGGKNVIFGKGGGHKYHILGKYTPLELSWKMLPVEKS